MPVGGGGGERRGPTAAGREQCTRPGRAAGNGEDPAAPLSALLSFSPSFLWPLLHPYVCLSVVSPRILFTVSLSLFDPVLPFVFLSRFWFRFFLSACLSPPPRFSLSSISPFPFSFLVSFPFPLPLPAPLGPLLCSMPPTHPCQETLLADTHASPPPGLCVVPRLQGGGIAGPGCGQSPRRLHRGPKKLPARGVLGRGALGGAGGEIPSAPVHYWVMGGQPGTHGRAQERGTLHAHGRGLPRPAGTTLSGCISCQTFRVFWGCKGEH